MRTKFLSSAALAACFAALSLAPAMAATFSGMITVTRDASRQITSAVLETSNRDGAGQPVTYNIFMDENGRAIAEQYENKDIKIDGMLNGKDIKADTWESVPDSSSGSSSSYNEPSSGDSGDSGDSGYSDDSGDSNDSGYSDDSGDSSDEPADSDDSEDSDEEPADKDNSEEGSETESDDNEDSDDSNNSEDSSDSSDESESSED